MKPILQICDLKTHFPMYSGIFRRRETGRVRAVDGVNLTLQPGEILGLVGESGCGKTTLSRTILQLVQATSGSVLFEGTDLCALSRKERRRFRGDIQMIFQDPYASLNPRITVFDTLVEALSVRGKVPNHQQIDRVAELLWKVGLNPASMQKYPHEFSGGQRQRIAIARALATRPRIIIADEPVSALDVSIQSQILNLIFSLSRDMGLTLIFISHDLSVVKYISDRIAVMYLGKIVELGDSETIMAEPLHYYTKALISAVPIPDPKREKSRRRIVLSGDPPSPMNPPEGCPFAWRSPLNCPPEICSQPGRFVEVTLGHWVELHPGTVDLSVLSAFEEVRGSHIAQA
jgi:oligopeptide transport system ATP-binding protein